MAVPQPGQWQCNVRSDRGVQCGLPYNHRGDHRAAAEVAAQQGSEAPTAAQVASAARSNAPGRIEQRYYYGRTLEAAQLAGGADSQTMVGLGYRFLRRDWLPARARFTRVFLYGAIGLLGGGMGRLVVSYQHDGPGIAPEPPPGQTAPGLRMVHVAIAVAAVAIVVIIVVGLATGGP